MKFSNIVIFSQSLNEKLAVLHVKARGAPMCSTAGTVPVAVIIKPDVLDMLSRLDEGPRVASGDTCKGNLGRN